MLKQRGWEKGILIIQHPSYGEAGHPGTFRKNISSEK
jgi:hypothetical protein